MWVYPDKTFALLSLLLSAAEQRVRLSANERRREYNEEQRNEYENYVEEERDGKTRFRVNAFLLTLPSLELRGVKALE